MSDYNEAEFRRLLHSRPELEPIDLWQTTGLRPECGDTVWLNVLLRKLAT